MAPQMAMDEYRRLGCMFCSSSYRRSRTYRLRSDFSAGFGAWLVIYPDQIALGANFIPWIGECLLPFHVDCIHIRYRSQGELDAVFSTEKSDNMSVLL